MQQNFTSSVASYSRSDRTDSDVEKIKIVNIQGVPKKNGISDTCYISQTVQPRTVIFCVQGGKRHI